MNGRFSSVCARARSGQRLTCIGDVVKFEVHRPTVNSRGGLTTAFEPAIFGGGQLSSRPLESAFKVLESSPAPAPR